MSETIKTVEDLPSEIKSLTDAEIEKRTQMLNAETRLLLADAQSVQYQINTTNDAIKEHLSKIKMHTQLPHAVGTFQEHISDEFETTKKKENSEHYKSISKLANVNKISRESESGNKNQNPSDKSPKNENAKENPDKDGEEPPNGKNRDGFEKGDKSKTEHLLDTATTGRSCVVSSSQRSTLFLKDIGLINPNDIKPGDTVALHKDTGLVLQKTGTDYDVRVKAFICEGKPSENFEDIGGLERQIEELNEAVVLPFIHPEKFIKLGVRAPKGVLMHGPPGTGKTLLARACAAKTKASFFRLAGPSLVQMYIGDGARLVRDAFAQAKDNAPAIVFIDEIDAIGLKRSDSDRTGDREVQRTMLELLNQLDGFTATEGVKVIAATNRVDILDPALLRSGRLDRKIEFPLPNVDGRRRILQIHARKMVTTGVNFEELARTTEGFNGAQLKAVCAEAGMCALRQERSCLTHKDFMDGVCEVMAKKRLDIRYHT